MSEEATADLLRGLSSSARKLDRPLTNLLDLEQLGWGTIPLNRQPFDIAALLKQVAARWRKETPWPQVCASSTTVWLDPDKVERIVEELLANTARHTPRGTPVGIRVGRQGTGLRLAAQACRARCAQWCSSASATVTPLPATHPVSASGSRWSFAWPSCTAAPPGSRIAPAAGHRSKSSCLDPRTDIHGGRTSS